MESKPDTRQSFLPSSVDSCIEDEDTWGKQSILPWKKKKLQIDVLSVLLYDASVQGFDKAGTYYTSFYQNIFSDNEISVYCFNRESRKLEASLIKLKARCQRYDPKTTRWLQITITKPKSGKPGTLEIRSDVLKEYLGTSGEIKSEDVSESNIVKLPFDLESNLVYEGDHIHKSQEDGDFYITLLRDKKNGKHFLYLFRFDEKEISHFKTISITDHVAYEECVQRLFINPNAEQFYIVCQKLKYNKPMNGESLLYKGFGDSGLMSGFDFKGKKLFMFPIVNEEKEYPHYWEYFAQCKGSQFLVVWLHTKEVEIFNATVDGMIRLKKFPLAINESFDQYRYRLFEGNGKHFLSVINTDIWSIDKAGVFALYDLDNGKLVFTYEHPQYKSIYGYDLNFETKELATTTSGGWFRNILEVSKLDDKFQF